MARPVTGDSLQRSREAIAAKVRALRVARKLTQAELAGRLQISQNRLSEIERGGGSFTAEQFLELLRVFNVTAADFAAEAPNHDLELQNALARLGALHLHESEIVRSAVLSTVHEVVREALLDGSPRFVTALAPVLVAHADTVNLVKLYGELQRLGLERRLPWLVENTLAALDLLAREKGSGATAWSRVKRRADGPLRLFIDAMVARRDASGHTPSFDPLDPTIRSLRTLEHVERAASPISVRWSVATVLQTSDFVEALRSARAAG